MKKFILIFFSALIFISCKNQKAEEKVQSTNYKVQIRTGRGVMQPEV